MSVYDYAQNTDLRNQKNFKFGGANKNHLVNLDEGDPARINNYNTDAQRWAKRNEAKFSVEFDYNSIVQNEVEKVQQFKDTVKLLEESKLMQGLAHQIHLCFRSYVKSDIKGYVKTFGQNEVTKDRVNIMLEVFSGHMLTILNKLVEGMNTTYMKSLFKKSEQEDKKNSSADELERLANQWSMHQLSPRTLNMSITSIQSAISKEILCDPIDGMTSRELNIPSGLKNKHHKFMESPQNIQGDVDECPKTEKMYERVEFMRKAGKAQLQNLVFPSEDTTPNISTSRFSKDKSHRRSSNKLTLIKGSRTQSKESNRNNTSKRREDVQEYNTTVER